MNDLRIHQHKCDRRHRCHLAQAIMKTSSLALSCRFRDSPSLRTNLRRSGLHRNSLLA